MGGERSGGCKGVKPEMMHSGRTGEEEGRCLPPQTMRPQLLVYNLAD